MRCPFCNSEDTQVKDSRPIEDNISIKRRRQCPKCNARFTTFERVQFRELIVVKKNGERRAFDRDKLARSINLAVRKRDVSQEKIESIVNTIVSRLEKSGENEIISSEIGAMVMEELAQTDQVAYIRFASVYRDFCEAKDFKQFVEENVTK